MRSLLPVCAICARHLLLYAAAGVRDAGVRSGSSSLMRIGLTDREFGLILNRATVPQRPSLDLQGHESRIRNFIRAPEAKAGGRSEAKPGIIMGVSQHDNASRAEPAIKTSITCRKRPCRKWQTEVAELRTAGFGWTPYGVVGALLCLAIMGSHFGFMAFLGITSLIGVIVSHIIIVLSGEMGDKGWFAPKKSHRKVGAD